VKQDIGINNMEKNHKQFLKMKRKILNQILIDTKEFGFNEKTLLISSKKCNISQGNLGRLFPEGISELKRFFLKDVDEKMLKKIKKCDYSKLRVREKIFNGVIIRLEILNKNKLSVKRILASEVDKPYKIIKNLWKISDLIWISAGDKSTDYNYYTKRSLLSWVYIATFLCWINDNDKKLSKTKIFLNKRIDEVLQFGKNSGKLKSIASNFNISSKIIDLLQNLKKNYVKN